MRNTSTPAANSLPIIAGSGEAGPRGASVLRRRRRTACRSSRCRKRQVRASRRSWRAAYVSLFAAFVWSGGRRGRGWPLRSGRRALRQRHLRLLLSVVGQLHRPGALLASVDLEESGAVEAARQAVVGAVNGEFLFARAHESVARPFAAMVVVDRIDVIKTRHQRAAQQLFAGAG